MNTNTPVSSLWQAIKRYITLNVESAKLSATEKLAILFSAVAFYLVAIILCVVAMVFVSMALCEVLSLHMEKHFVYLIMGTFYIIVLMIVCVMKKQLFLNPIARFFSKLLLNPPKENNE